MSTPSKRRRKAREWMHKERERSKQMASDQAERARRIEADGWRRRVELIVPPDEHGDVFYPQGKPSHPYMKVCAPKQMPIFDLSEPRAQMMIDPLMDIVSIRARQMAHRLPNGRTIMWWTWEIGS